MTKKEYTRRIIVSLRKKGFINESQLRKYLKENNPNYSNGRNTWMKNKGEYDFKKSREDMSREKQNPYNKKQAAYSKPKAKVEEEENLMEDDGNEEAPQGLITTLKNALEDAREVLLHYMDAPEWDMEQDEVYEKVKAAIKKADDYFIRWDYDGN